MDEADVESQCDPGSGDARAECELVASDNDDAVAAGGALYLDRSRSCSGPDGGRCLACGVRASGPDSTLREAFEIGGGHSRRQVLMTSPASRMWMLDRWIHSVTVNPA